MSSKAGKLKKNDKFSAKNLKSIPKISIIFRVYVCSTYTYTSKNGHENSLFLAKDLYKLWQLPI